MYLHNRRICTKPDKYLLYCKKLSPPPSRSSLLSPYLLIVLSFHAALSLSSIQSVPFSWQADIERLKHVLKHEINYAKRYNIATRFCYKFVAMFGHNAKAHCPKLLNSYLDSVSE